MLNAEDPLSIHIDPEEMKVLAFDTEAGSEYEISFVNLRNSGATGNAAYTSITAYRDSDSNPILYASPIPLPLEGSDALTISALESSKVYVLLYAYGYASWTEFNEIQVSLIKK
jgi:hypothetical protein